MVHIVLRKCFFLGKLDNFLLKVPDHHFIRLITSRPDHNIGLLNMLSLFFGRWALQYLYALFIATFHLFVQAFGIASQPGERIEVAFLSGKAAWVVIGVSIILGCLNFAIKHANPIPIEDLDIPFLKVRYVFFVIKAPVTVLEEPITTANTLARAGRRFLTRFRRIFIRANILFTEATLVAVSSRLKHGTGKLVGRAFFVGLLAGGRDAGVVPEGGRAVEEDPRS